MWTCPKCGRTFTRCNQGHYCGKAPETADAYIASQSEEAQPHLRTLKNILCLVPEIRERIAWSMPVYTKGKHSVSFAACKNHISFYAEPEALEVFRSQLSEFTIRKNAIYLPYERELPVKLLERLVQQCFEES